MKAKSIRNYRRPNGLNSLEPPLTAIDTVGELVLQTTRLLANQLSYSFFYNGIFNVLDRFMLIQIGIDLKEIKSIEI